MKTELNNPRDKIKVVTMNGSLMPLNKAKVSVTAPGLSYAALVFEGIRAYWNDKLNELYIFRLDEHLVRFHIGLEDPNDLIADLAWWVLEHRLTPLGLYQDYESGHFRDPKTDEDCQFHNWFNEIYKSPHISFSSEHGGTIAYHLFTTDDSAHNITDQEASTLLHMLDCDTIKNYIKYLIRLADDHQNIDKYKDLL